MIPQKKILRVVRVLLLTAVAVFAHLLVRRLEVSALQAALDERALSAPPEDP